jgi:hypothetical protein
MKKTALALDYEPTISSGTSSQKRRSQKRKVFILMKLELSKSLIKALHLCYLAEW